MKKVGRPIGTTIKIELSIEERKAFNDNQKKGKHRARVLKRQKILLLADDGMQPELIAEREKITLQTVYNTFDRYLKTGSTEDRARSGRPEKMSGKVKAHVVATACTEPPEGRGRWTLRLLADHVVQFEMLDSISKDTIGRVLKKTNSNLGNKKAGA